MAGDASDRDQDLRRKTRAIDPADITLANMRLGKLSYADVDADLDGALDTRWLYGPLGEIRVKERLSEGTL